MGKTAYAVIGSSYGDEGKGLVTDYLTSTLGADLVVRFNGGAQAGHTVETPAEVRHVFHHIGSGTFGGAATYLSQHFITNPILFLKEWDELRKKAPLLRPQIYVDGRSLVTTPFDMIINQQLEKVRFGNRHGSCGVGIYETVLRSSSFKLTAKDLYSPDLRYKLDGLFKRSPRYRLQQLGFTGLQISDILRDQWNIAERFFVDCEHFTDIVELIDSPEELMESASQIIFEGAQGLALDQSNREDFPHLTPSNTGLENVVSIVKKTDIDSVRPVYVTRPYITRHGAGPLPHSDDNDVYLSKQFEDKTNVKHDFQGELRFAPMDVTRLKRRIFKDLNTHGQSARVGRPSLFVTCLNQMSGFAHYVEDKKVYTKRLSDIAKIMAMHLDMPHYESWGKTRIDCKADSNLGR